MGFGRQAEVPRPTDAEMARLGAEEEPDEPEPDMAGLSAIYEGSVEGEEGRNVGTCLGLGRRGVSSVAGRMDIPCRPQVIMTTPGPGTKRKGRRRRIRMKRTRKLPEPA